MGFQLDTSAAIPVRDGDDDALNRLELLGNGVSMSIMARIELEGGVHRKPELAAFRRARLDEMLLAIPVLPFDQPCVDAYSKIINTLGYSRRKVLDRLIAAQAMASGDTLITLNPSDFDEIPDLKLVIW